MAGGIPANLDLSAVLNIGFLSPSSFVTNVAGGAGGQAIPQVTGVNTNFPQLVQQAQDAAYKSTSQYLDSQFQQQEETLRQSLADQGIEEGSPAFSRAMLDFNNQKQQAYFVAVVVPLLVNGASEAWFGYRDQRATLSSRLHAERSDLHRGRRLSVPRLCDRDLGRQRQRRQLQGTTGTAYSCSSSRTIGHAPCSWTAWITCSAAI